MRKAAKVKNGYNEKVVGSLLEFRWSVSRGYETYGYNICSLWVDGRKVASCNGGGYDMKGTSLGNWLEKSLDLFPGIVKLAAGSNHIGNKKGTFYGLAYYDKTARKWRKHYKEGYSVVLDGGCGFSCMENILGALGLKLRFVSEKRNTSTYIIERA